MHQLLFNGGCQVHHARNHLAGEVVKILCHHDFREVRVGLFGHTLHVVQEVEYLALGHGSHRVGDQRIDDPACFRRNVVVLRLGLLDAVEHFLGGLARQPGDVRQPALGVGQFAHGAAQLVGVPQFIQ